MTLEVSDRASPANPLLAPADPATRQPAPGTADRTPARAASDYRRELNGGQAVQPGTSLLPATSEALGDVGSSDVAVVVPKYRVFMKAGHAPTHNSRPIQRPANSETTSRVVPRLRPALRGKRV